jgi:NADPH:quinone reductase-like Zn-dependent oxidoreductase
VRAIVVDRVGPDARPRIAEVPVATPGAGEVLVRVEFASINPADWKCRSGWMLPFPQFRPDSPFVLGFDGVGAVVAIGTDVDDVRIGDRVCVRANQMTGQNGTFAETVCVARSDTAPIPDELPGEHAATIPVAGVTAYQSITKYARVAPGQRVLVNGAAGGVGSYAVQLAVHAGARVAGTCGADNAAYLRELGCEYVINYRTQNIRDAARVWAEGGVHVLLDTVNVGGVPNAGELLRPGGVVVGVVTLGADQPYRDEELRPYGSRFVAATVKRDEARADMITLARLLADGSIRPPAVEVISFDEAPRALDRIGAGHVRGKIVVAIGGAG